MATRRPALPPFAVRGSCPGELTGVAGWGRGLGRVARRLGRVLGFRSGPRPIHSPDPPCITEAVLNNRPARNAEAPSGRLRSRRRGKAAELLKVVVDMLLINSVAFALGEAMGP